MPAKRKQPEQPEQNVEKSEKKQKVEKPFSEEPVERKKKGRPKKQVSE